MAKKQLTIEEKLQAALVPAEEQPYKVPENWCWVRLDNINEHKSTTVDPQNYPNDDFELYSVPSSADDYPEMITGEEIGSTKQVVQKDDVLLCKINPRINRVWKVSQYTDNRLLASSEWIIVRNKNILSDYLMWCFRTPFFRKYMLSHVSGVGGSLMRAQPKYVKTYPVPLPTYKEQSRIVARIESLFAKLDEAKEKIQEVLDGADLRRAAILHQAFTGKLTEKWRKENSVDDKSWEFTSLGNICYINPKKIDTTNFDDDMEVSFIPMADVSDISGEVIGNQTRTLGEVKKGFTNFNEGDVVFAKITPCMENGKSAIIGKLKNNVGYGTTEFYVLRPKETLYNRYVYHLVRSKFFRDKAKSNMTGAVGQQRVPKKFMQEYEINLPSLPEQQEIVRLLDNLLSREQSTVTACEEALTTIDTLKKSILARAFRGELGTNDPSEVSAKELLQEILAS